MEQWELLWIEAKQKLKDLVEAKKIPLDKICLSFSGGRDSTLMLHMIEELGWKNKIKIVFFNTYMEMDAIVRFVNEKRNEGWIIEETRPRKNHLQIYKEYGYPFHSKKTSEMIHRLQQHNFDFFNDTYKSFEELYEKYPKCRSALRWLTGYDMLTIKCPDWVKRQLVFLNLRISNKCCEYLKKKPVKDYNEQNNIILSLIGVRQSESLQRKAAYKGCVWTDGKTYKFFPLLYFNDNDVKQAVINKQIKLSDAYTVYGMERTGWNSAPSINSLNA